MNLNLSSDKNLLIELGGSECWPQQGVTREIEVQQALQYVLTELGHTQDSTQEDYACPSYLKSTLTDTKEVEYEQHTQPQLSRR